MANKILEDIKLDLGLPEDYDVFDPTVLRHINTALSRLTQIGIGPPSGFKLSTGDETWESFLGNQIDMEDVKGFVFLRCRLIFDPPATSFHITAIEKQLDELIWTISEKREGKEWVNPLLTP